VFDPGEIGLIRQTLGDDYRVVFCRHDLSIPVGIGFSLPMLPSLILNGNWRSILAEPMKQLPSVKVELERLGLVMDQGLSGYA
jgi:hypothetical protein